MAKIISASKFDTTIGPVRLTGFYCWRIRDRTVLRRATPRSWALNQ
jgi:hypothetical protein